MKKSTIYKPDGRYSLTIGANSLIREKVRRIPLIVTAYVWLRHILCVGPAVVRYIGQWLYFKTNPLLRRAPKRFQTSWHSLYPCLFDHTGTTGFDRHYTFHTAWAARILAQTRPQEHRDIGSAVYFAGIVSAFVPMRFYDVRPAALRLSNLMCEEANLTQLPFASDSVPSLSCMHVIEHVGLGRYGDRLDPDGDLKAIAELKRVVMGGGDLLFVTPVGATAVIQFNAHRIYTPDMIKDYFADTFDLQDWTLIPERATDGDLVQNPAQELLARQFYACGCFWFKKRKAQS